LIAALAHKDGTRKGKDIPYIIHPVEVAMILQENEMDDDIIITGLLHDTLEDTELTKNELKKFDKSIARDLDKNGEELWDRINACYDKQKWYYTDLVKSLENIEENEIRHDN